MMALTATKTTITGSKSTPMVMAAILTGRFMKVHLPVCERKDGHKALSSKLDDPS
jgi:hypothetical protein